jgi:hypothetical protein
MHSADGVLLGSGGPSALLGKAATKGFHQTELSRRLRPPMKWSYLKLIGWLVLALLVSLIAYVHMVMECRTSVFPARRDVFCGPPRCVQAACCRGLET